MGLSSVLGFAKRGLKVLPDFILGTGSEVAGKAMRATKGSIWTKAKAGAKGLEAHVAKETVKKGGFFKRLFKDLVSLPKSMITSAKAGSRAAKIAGKSSALGATKGIFKAIGKKMPMIGAVLTLAFEIPEIIKGVKKGGVKGGIAKSAGAVTELGAMAAGAAIGSAICPGIGTLVGGIIGGIAGSFIRKPIETAIGGEKMAEENEEAEESAEQPVAYTQQEVEKLRSYGLSDEEIAQAQAKGYTVQDVEAVLKGSQDVAPQDNTRVDNTQARIEALERENQQLREQLNISQSSAATNPFTSAQSPAMGWVQPFQYNQGLGNQYSNDFFYNQAFSGGGNFDMNSWKNPEANRYFRYAG